MALLTLSVAAFLLFHGACLGKGVSLDQMDQESGHWDNDFDGVLDFRCRDDSHAVTSIKSYHSNHQEDRRFEVFCSQVKSISSQKSCYWTNNVNDFDALAHFTCKSNYYINGMQSSHNNYHEDRLWKCRCCQITGVTMEACVLSGWTNDWDEPQHFRAPYGHVLKGMVSVHDNYREDRLYEYLVCKVGDARSTQLPASLLE